MLGLAVVGLLAVRDGHDVPGSKSARGAAHGADSGRATRSSIEASRHNGAAISEAEAAFDDQQAYLIPTTELPVPEIIASPLPPLIEPPIPSGGTRAMDNPGGVNGSRPARAIPGLE